MWVVRVMRIMLLRNRILLLGISPASVLLLLLLVSHEPLLLFDPLLLLLMLVHALLMVHSLMVIQSLLIEMLLLLLIEALTERAITALRL